jgi:serine-aspartate repeat-containing protein C/D/E
MKWGIGWGCVLFLACLTVCASGAFDLDVVENITYGLPETDESAVSIAQDGEGNLVVAGISGAPGLAGNDALFLRIADADIFQERFFKGCGYGAEFDVIQASNGNMVVAGTCANLTQGHPGSTDIRVTEIDPAGNEVMNATFGDHDTNETACGIIRTSDGGYLIAGYAGYPGTRRSDGLVVKIDASATEEWRRTFGGVLDDMVYSAVEDTNGDIIVAGSTESFGNGEADGWVVRMNLSGREIWNRTYGGIKADAARDLIRTPDGIIVFAGITTYVTGTERTDTDAWLVTLNSSGESLVDVTYGGADVNASAESIVRTPDGGYLLAGSIGEYGTAERDAWLVKADAMGNAAGEMRLGGAFDDTAYALIALSGSDYAFCGMFGAGASGQGSDAWVVRLAEPLPPPPATEVIDASPAAEPDERTEEDRNEGERYGEDTCTEENASDDAGQDRGDEGEAGDDDRKDDDDKKEDDDEEDGDEREDDDPEGDGEEENDEEGEQETDERDRRGWWGG